jgi:hypothetical protein
MVTMVGMTMALGQPARANLVTVAPPNPVTAVAADGWRATIDTATAARPQANEADIRSWQSSPVSVDVTRPGFDASGNATTYTDAVQLNGKLRNPWSAGGAQNTLTADTGVLSQYVHAGDTLPAGVTNSSTRAYPTPQACWTQHDCFNVTDTTFTVNLVVTHAYARNGRPVAAVRIIATQGVTTREVLVSSLTFQSWAATGLGVDTYQATFTSADFTAGAEITVNAIVFPWVGPSYNLATQGNPAPNMKNTVLRCYRVTPVFAYISATGSDATGQASANAATAAGLPFLTINGALTTATRGIQAVNLATFGRNEVGGGVVRFPVGTSTIAKTGMNPIPVTTACVVYESINPADKATTIIENSASTAGTQNVPGRVVFRNLTMRKNGDAVGLIRGAVATSGVTAFVNCTFDRAGQTLIPTAPSVDLCPGA